MAATEPGEVQHKSMRGRTFVGMCRLYEGNPKWREVPDELFRSVKQLLDQHFEKAK